MSAQTPPSIQGTASKSHDAQHRVAAVVSEVLAPWVVAAVMPPVIGALSTTPVWRGAVTGLMVTTLTAVIPYAVITARVRRGRCTDRHLARRQDRPAFLVLVVALTALALGVTYALDGSETSLVFTVLTLVTAAVGAIVSHWWKISMHALVLAASLAMLVSLHPPLAILAALVPIVIWARLRLSVHTPAQLVTGATLGVFMGAAATLAT